MSEYESFVAPETLTKTSQAEVIMLFEEDESAVVYQGLRQVFIDQSRSSRSVSRK